MIAQTPTIFGGNTGMTYEQLKRKRAIAEKLMGSAQAPRNVGEGLNAIGKALLVRSMNKKADKRDAELKSQFDEQFGQVAPNHQGLADLANSPYAGKGHQKVISALLKGVPNYKRGTPFHNGGRAVVGEDGPEVVDLPMGARVTPAQANGYDEGGPASDPNYRVPMDGYVDPPEPDDYLRDEMGDSEFERYRGMSREQRLDYMNNPENGFVPPAPGDMREIIPQYDAQNSFQEGAEFKTADLAGIGPDDFNSTQNKNIQDAAFSYATLMKNMDAYEQTFKEGGGTMLPGARKDSLDTQHRNLQMQMKELYALGVLNGPDLMLMDQILLSPTSISGNLMDAVGMADMDERIPANIARVRTMMKNMVEPKLKAANIDINDLAPPKQLSDDEFLKSLGLE